MRRILFFSHRSDVFSALIESKNLGTRNRLETNNERIHVNKSCIDDFVKLFYSTLQQFSNHWLAKLWTATCRTLSASCGFNPLIVVTDVKKTLLLIFMCAELNQSAVTNIKTWFETWGDLWFTAEQQSKTINKRLVIFLQILQII